MYIVLAIIIFGLMVATHELGHFIAAKSCGVRVLEFSIGMGPAIWKKQKGETQYSLRAFPVGGFCAMEGEDDESPDPRAFTNQPVWKRLIILCSGSAVHIVLGFLVVLLVFASAPGFRSPTVTSFYEGCPYEGEGALEIGDSFYRIEGHRVFFSSDVGDFLQRAGTDTPDIVVIRDGEKVRLEDFRMVPVEYEEDGETLTLYGLRFEQVDTGFGNYIRYSWYTTLDFVRQVWFGLFDLVSGNATMKDMTGVVGIVDVINDVGRESGTFAAAMNNIGYITALVLVNLAVVNMLPLPALDGGRVFLLLVTKLVELISRRRVDPKYEGYIHAAGLVLLLGLMVLVLYNDIVRIVTRQ